MELSDTVLVMRWQRGDAEAAAEVLRRYTDSLGAVAYRILADTWQAQEAVQEAFARANARIHRLDKPARVGLWLIGITREAAVDAARKRRREPPSAKPEQNLGQDTIRSIRRVELREYLRNVVAALPAEDQEVFFMKYLTGLNHEQIGNALGISRDGAGQKLLQVRERLQQEMKEFLL
ncbi:MAG: sigma-70 family RNA polymerase sigma factor [Candidatus Hydrogenedentes bacterium]|nr:sigma-70 family RNA polymerase sigma factor [Candidatus Hydrogenedentota bacterium]